MTANGKSLSEIADYLGASYKGDADCLITGLAPLDSAQSGQVSFLSDPKYIKFLSSTNASAVILNATHAANCNINCITVDDPYVAYAKIAALFSYKPEVEIGIHSSCVVAESCDIDATASIGPHCVIGSKVRIGKNVIIGAGTVIGEQAVIDDNSLLYPRVTLYHGVVLGKNTIIHSGVVIGSDGFGLAKEEGKWLKIPQLGSVVIEDNVEIGANTTVDRGALDNTTIKKGAKLDNQIQVGHNVVIGENTAIAGCVGIAGSTVIGKNCIIGGGCGISGHLKIVDNVILSGRTCVGSDITKPGVYASGIHAQELRLWKRNMFRLFKLDEMFRKVNKMDKQRTTEIE